ncbi:MAG: hypothetical protein NC131_21320 [Roseburia sp.]|nr:hypothetical protein [Roseburia sp.]
MNLVYIGLLILMCTISFSIFYCTMFYICVKLQELKWKVEEREEAKKKASEKSDIEENEIFKDIK